MKYYAGIGSRKAPKSVLDEMTEIASVLSREGYTLRSGAATGSDQAFQKGVIDTGVVNAQIWLPWRGFEKEFTDQYPNHEYRFVDIHDGEAWNAVEKFHPNFNKMFELVDTFSEGKYQTFMNFMGRNYRQVRGIDGEPDSSFIICWTDGGGEKGGTGQAIRIANYFNIPIFNLFNMRKGDVLKEIEKLNLLY